MDRVYGLGKRAMSSRITSRGPPRTMAYGRKSPAPARSVKNQRSERWRSWAAPLISDQMPASPTIANARFDSTFRPLGTPSTVRPSASRA